MFKKLKITFVVGFLSLVFFATAGSTNISAQTQEQVNSCHQYAYYGFALILVLGGDPDYAYFMYRQIYLDCIPSSPELIATAPDLQRSSTFERTMLHKKKEDEYTYVALNSI